MFINKRKRMEALLEAARFGEEEVVRELLAALAAGHGEAGLDVNGRDARGNTALHMACANGHLEIVHLLLRPSSSSSSASSPSEDPAVKVDVNAQNEHGNTALHWVATQPTLTKEHLAIAESLLAAGASPNMKNDRGRTPLNEAADREHKDLCELLVQHEGRLGEAEPGEKDEFFTASSKEEQGSHHGADKQADDGEDECEDVQIVRCGNAKCGRPEGKGENFNRCSRCKARYYCSRNCQRADWPTHKASCSPP